MAAPTDTVSLRITLRYQNLDEFVTRYAENISSAGLFLRTKAPKPAGTKVRFELLLADGAKALRGEGVVVTVRQDDKPGMALRFNTLDAESQAVIDKIVEVHGQGALAPTPLSTSFGKGAEAKVKVAASWRAQKGGPTGWSSGALPRASSNASILPRRASRVFGTGTGEIPLPANPMEPPDAGDETEGATAEEAPSGPGVALPRKRSSIPRPWATSGGRPGENTDRVRVRELLPRGRLEAEGGATQRINTPLPVSPPPPEAESDRTQRLEMGAFGALNERAEVAAFRVEPGPVGEAHVPTSEFGTVPDSQAQAVEKATTDLQIEEYELEVPEAVVTPAADDEGRGPELAELGASPSAGFASETTIAADPAELRDSIDQALAPSRAPQDEAEFTEASGPEAAEQAEAEAAARDAEARVEAAERQAAEAAEREAIEREGAEREAAEREAAEREAAEREAAEAARAAPELQDQGEATAPHDTDDLDRPSEAPSSELPLEHRETPPPLAAEAYAETPAPTIPESPIPEPTHVELNTLRTTLAPAGPEPEVSAADETPAEAAAASAEPFEPDTGLQGTEGPPDGTDWAGTRDTADVDWRRPEAANGAGEEAASVAAPVDAPAPLSAEAGWADALGIPPTVPPRPATPVAKPFDELQTLSNVVRGEAEAEDAALELHGLSGDLGPKTQVIDRPDDQAEAQAEVTAPPPTEPEPGPGDQTPVSRAAPMSMDTPLPQVQALPPIEPPRALFAQEGPVAPTADPRPVAPIQSVQISSDLGESEPPTSLADAAASLGLDLAEVRARAVTDAATEIVSSFQDPRVGTTPTPFGASGPPSRLRAEVSDDDEVSFANVLPREDSAPPRTESAPRPNLAPARPASGPGRGVTTRSSSVPGAYSGRVSVTGVDVPSNSESGEQAPESPRPPPRLGPFRPVIERDQGQGHDDPAAMLREARAAAFSEEATEVPPERDSSPAASTQLITERKAPAPAASGDRATGDLPFDKSRVVGIDWGAHWVRIGIIEHGELEVIQVGGASYLPALVGARADGGLVVGAKARSILNDDPTRVVSPLAVLMAIQGSNIDAQRAGVRVVSYDAQRVLLKLGERTVDLAEVLATFFGALKGAVASHLGNERFRALIAIPSNLAPEAQHLLEAACQEARLRVARYVPEAEAMLQAYNLQEHPVDTVLLVDVGIAHLGVSLARRSQDELKVVDSFRDDNLSASVIDRIVTDLTLEELATKAGEDHRQDPVARVRLMEAIEYARLDIKRMSTVDLKVTLPAPGGAAGVGVERSIKLPRARIYQLTEGLSRDTCAQVQEFLKRNGIEPRVLDAVVVAGSGGTYPPLVQALGQLTQKEPMIAVPAAQVFALGLARQGVALERAESTVRPDTLHASIGMELPGGRFRPLLGAGAKLPAHFEKIYPSTRDNQGELELNLFQGDAEFVRSCTPLGTLSIAGLPKGARGSVKITLRLEVATDGVLTARLQEPTEDVAHSLVLATAQTPEARKKALPAPRRQAPRPEPPAKASTGFFGRLFKK